MIELPDIEKTINEETQMIETNGNWVVTKVNQPLTKVSKYTGHELIGKSLQKIHPVFHLESFQKMLTEQLELKKIWRGAVLNRKKDGTVYWESLIVIPYTNDEGKNYKYILISLENRARKNHRNDESNESFQTMIKHLENTIFKYVETEDGRIVFTLSEGKISERIGFVTEVIENREVKEFFPKDVWPIMEQNFRKALTGEAINFEMHLLGTDFLVYLSPIQKGGEIIEVVGTAIDITERKKHEALVQYMAYHDSLTGLLNRAAFQDALTEAVQKGAQEKTIFAVLYIDLNRFKNINDTFGHRVGDHLLTAVGKCLQEIVGETAAVARLGGDEYAIIVEDQTEEEVEQIVQHIIAQFSNPFEVKGQKLYTMPSIGISLYPKDAIDEQTLLNYADMAMYDVKNNTEKAYSFFTETLSDKVADKKLLESELKRALNNEEFILHYQPQVHMRTKEVFGVEALIRWEHPTRGLVFPGDFIPIAEETGLIIPIGEWVLKEASEQNKKWQDAGYKPIVISVNVAPQQFMKRGFIDIVTKVLDETGLAPHHLELEITESTTVDMKATEKLLVALQEIGVKVSIDDFGTGYSSLNYLSQLSINKLKIDQSFIREMDVKNEAIVKTIIALAKNLNMDVIAEGVEMSEHVDFLKKQECYYAQGYFFSKPLPEKELLDYFSASRKIV